MEEVFRLEDVAELRRHARKATRIREVGPEGWSKSETDPHNLLAVFEPLRLRPGLALRAYLFRSAGNGNGVVWAVPANAPSPSPECLAGSFSPVPGVAPSEPRPPGALDRLMDAIEGDGSAWSYLCASIFAREAREFGTLRHGVSWGETAIIGGDPFGGGPIEGGAAGGFFEHPQSWTWHAAAPGDWRPTVTEGEHGREVVFHTYSAVMPETFRRHRDRYGPTGYRFSEEGEDRASGRGGVVF